MELQNVYNVIVFDVIANIWHRFGAPVQCEQLNMMKCMVFVSDRVTIG